MAVNSWNEPKDDLAKFAEDQNLKHRICLEGRSVAQAYGVKVVPTVLWIARDGRVVDVELGFDGPEALDRRTRRLLEEGA